MMIYYVAALVFATALMVVAFLLSTTGNIDEFKECWTKSAQKISEFPIITCNGKIVYTVEDLDMQMQLLENQLADKEQDLESKKIEQEATAEQLQKLTETSNQVKKFYVKLKTDVTRSETQINELKKQIDDFKKRQSKLKDEVNENVKYYCGMLNIAEHDDVNGEYEFVKNMQIEN